MGLTSAGEIFLQCCCQVLDNLARVRDLLAGQSSTNSGRLSVAVPATFCHWLLPHLIDAFRERFPAIQLCVSMTDVDIAMERSPIVKSISRWFRPLYSTSIGVAPLGKDELVAVISTGNPLAQRTAAGRRPQAAPYHAAAGQLELRPLG